MGGTDQRGRHTRRIAYAALPSQRRFHKSLARFKGFSGPIGSGKSMALCHEAIKLSYLNPGRLGLLGAPTYPMLRDATQTALLETLQRNSIPYELNKAENILVMKDTGSRILFRSVDDFERLRGTNLAWFGVDELTYCPEESWLRLEGRLRDPRASRLCGFGVWTPKGFDWVYRRFLAEAVEGYEVAIARAFENRHLLNKVPDFYERLKHSYDERFYRQEVMGEYLNIHADRVYSSFDRAVHVRECQLDVNLPLMWALDFNIDPMSSVIAQIDRGTVRVLDEIVLRRASTRDACEEYGRRFRNHAAGTVVYGDASGQNMQTTGRTDYQIVAEYFRSTGGRVECRVPRSNPAVRERVMLMNAKLRSAAGTIELLVDPRCKELVKDLEEVSYKPGSSVVDKDKDPLRTHLSDALGYLVWQECRQRPPAGEQGQRLL